MRKFVVLAVLVAFMALAVLAIQKLGLWAIPVGVLVLVALPFLLRVFLRKAFNRFLMGLFGAKGAGLRNATVHVRTIEPASAPQKNPTPPNTDADMDGEPAGKDDESFVERDLGGPVVYWMVDATIRPSAKNEGGFSHWEPGELRLIRSGSKPMDDDTDVGHVEEVQVLQDGKWIVDEGMKYGGEQTLRLLLAVKEGVRDAELAYYFESLAKLQFAQRAEITA